MSDSDATNYRERARELHEGRREGFEPGGHLDPERLIEELRIHQIELELQNQDLLEARKEAEAARDHYFLLFDAAPTAYLLVDAQGKIIQANIRASELLERLRGNLPGTKLSAAFTGDDLSRVDYAVEVAAKGYPIDEEWYVLRGSGGERRYVHLRITTWGEAAEESPRQLLVSIIDETDRKLREEEQQQAVNHYRTLLRELTHRVKNNLQVLSSIVELERRKGPTEETFSKLVERIRGLAQAHTALHDASRDADSVDLRAMLEDVVAQTAETLPPKIECRFDSGTEEVVLGSQRALTVSLVVNELLTNAVRHAFREGEAGAITLGLRRIQDRVRVIVSDSGVGMDIEHPTESAGIGTQLVMQLVDELRGSWEMTSPVAEGRGLRHTVEFPVQ